MVENEQARAAYDARVAYLKPLTNLTAGAAWGEVAGQLASIRADYRDDEVLGVHVQALADIMPRVMWALAACQPVEPPATLPALGPDPLPATPSAPAT